MSNLTYEILLSILVYFLTNNAFGNFKVIRLVDMQNVFTYIANDAECFAAIKDLENGMDDFEWLRQNLDLYMNVTFGPNDRPRIADCNYEGREFEYISEFASLYIKTHHEHKDPFSDPPDSED